MKAKEYAERYRQTPTTEELKKIAFDFLMEIRTLVQVRHAKSNEALFTILSELENKWRVFASLSGDETIRPDGFEKLIERHFSFVYHYWINSKKGAG